MLVSTACLSGAILLIIGTATGMAWGLTRSGFSNSLAAAMTGLPEELSPSWRHRSRLRRGSGSVLEGIPAIVLFGRCSFPIAKTVGIHEVHYAMVVILAMGIGLFAPAIRRRLLRRLRHRPRRAGRRHAADLGYMLALIIGTIVVAAVPWISTGFLK